LHELAHVQDYEQKLPALINVRKSAEKFYNLQRISMQREVAVNSLNSPFLKDEVKICELLTCPRAVLYSRGRGDRMVSRLSQYGVSLVRPTS